MYELLKREMQSLTLRNNVRLAIAMKNTPQAEQELKQGMLSLASEAYDVGHTHHVDGVAYGPGFHTEEFKGVVRRLTDLVTSFTRQSVITAEKAAAAYVLSEIEEANRSGGLVFDSNPPMYDRDKNNVGKRINELRAEYGLTEGGDDESSLRFLSGWQEPPTQEEAP